MHENHIDRIMSNFSARTPHVRTGTTTDRLLRTSATLAHLSGYILGGMLGVTPTVCTSRPVVDSMSGQRDVDDIAYS